MKNPWALAPFSTALLASLGGVAILAAAQADLFAPQWSLLLLTVLLMGYLLIEVARLFRVESYRWLINPVVLCSLMIFVLSFGATNFLYFLSGDNLASVGLLPVVTSWMEKLMALVLLGAIALWLGYWSGIARSLALWLARARFPKAFLKSDFTLRPGVLIALALVSLVSRLIQIKLGVFGYGSDYDRLMETAGFRQYLSLSGGLGKLALAITALCYYSPSPARNTRNWLIGLLIYEVLFGFLSAFKSQVAMPFVIVGACQYLRVGRLPRRYIMIVPIALIAAYAVIEPFRAARYEDSAFTGTQLSSISATMVGSVVSGADDAVPDEKPSTAVAILSRFNMTYIASLGIEYADSGWMDGDAPDFMGDIFRAPIYALIPRFLWEGKETSRHGIWYYNEVMGVPGLTSVGMSPFTYLYLAGGALAVAFGFFFIGVTQRVMADVFLVSPKAGATIPFLVLLPALVQIDSVFYSYIIELVRMLPLALLLQYLIFRR